MATKITTPFNILNAYSFLDNFNSTPSFENYLYVAIGRETIWPDDNLPPSPTNAPDQRTDMWDDMIGVQKVAATDLALMIPRIDWQSGTEYDVFDPSSTTAFDDNFYVVNSEYRVYKVLTKTPDPGAVTVTEPLGHNNGNPINTGDGYTWQFLYDIGLADIQNLVNSGWVPVNVLDNVSSEQTLYGDLLAYKTLGAKYLLVRAKLEDTGLPTTVTYRQIALVVNPYESGGVTAATASIYLKAALELYSGDMIHLENRKPITRNIGQSETVQLIVEF